MPGLRVNYNNLAANLLRLPSIDPRIVLLGDIEGADVLSTTPDQTPELQFKIPAGWTLTQIELEDSANNTYGPFSVAGGIANVGVTLPDEVYSVINPVGLDDEANALTEVPGTITIRTQVEFDTSFDESFA